MKVTLKAARVNAGLTQDQACNAIKVAKSTLVSWEQEKTFPTAVQLSKLCSLYRCTMNDIFVPETLT